MPSKSVEYLKSKYYTKSEHPYEVYERLVLSNLTSTTTVLDYGCGRTAPNLVRWKHAGRKLFGVDLIDFTVSDPDLTLIKTCLPEPNLTWTLPIASGSVDLITARSVVEHLRDPRKVFTELNRVLKPCGAIVFLTANFWDYGSLIAAVIPNSLHPKIVAKVEGRKENDTFPTEYRANTRGEIESISRNTGFKISEFEYLTQYPNYLQFSAPLFAVGIAYERFTKNVRGMGFLRSWILCKLVKI